MQGFVGQRWAEHLAHGLDAHVAVLELPLVIGLEQHGADQADDGGLGGKDADHVGAPLHFLVQALERVYGMQLGAALKNVIALAAGIADGLGYGDNTKAALITRGIHEIARLGEAAGGKRETFQGLTGIGDLIVTCASMHSRNRRAGILIGQGKSYEEAMAEVKQIVEGVYSAKAAMALAAKYNVQLPIISQVNDVLFNGKDPGEALKDLMNRDRKNEY